VDLLRGVVTNLLRGNWCNGFWPLTDEPGARFLKSICGAGFWHVCHHVMDFVTIIYYYVNVYKFVQMICSYVLWPFAFLSGVNIPDCRTVGQLIGRNIFVNPFVAYHGLTVLMNNRRVLESHMALNGTWYWSDDDVILTTTGSEDIVLRNGFITVQNSTYF